MDIRVGIGYDVHRFAADRRLFLCGVEFENSPGLEGHSDADVAIHALMDALLGALGLADIGKLFPDSKAEFKDIDSMLLLKKVLELPEFSEWVIGNCDITIIAQRPKLSAYREMMRQRTAEVLNVDVSRVSVKFTTTEELGFTGRGEGIASSAVVLLKKS